MIELNKIYVIPEKNNMEPYIKLAKDYGIRFEYNDFFWPANLDKPGYIDETVAFYKGVDGMPSGNTLHGSFLDVTIFSRDEKIKKISEDRLRESMDIASRLHARAVIIHTNFIPNFQDDVYEDYWVESNAFFIKKLLDEYPDISIYMENMFDESPKLLHRLATFMEGNERFGVCLDYAHVNVFGKTNSLEWIKLLAPYVKHIHINDNDLNKDSHMALGDGLIDYKMFFRLYEKYFNEATVLIEVNGIEKITKSLEFIKNA